MGLTKYTQQKIEHSGLVLRSHEQINVVIKNRFQIHHIVLIQCENLGLPKEDATSTDHGTFAGG